MLMKKYMKFFAAVAIVIGVMCACSAERTTVAKEMIITPSFNNTVQRAFDMYAAEKVESFATYYRRIGHDKVHGIYVTGPIAGSASMDGLIELADKTEINTMVIDIKNDEGVITCEAGLEMADELGACIRYIPDIEALMTKLKEHNIYTIARIVCFKDAYLASVPQYALKKTDGSPVKDANGTAYVNPYCRETWEYIVDVAKKAAEWGFDEIQFDYVRFPVGSGAANADYGVDLSVYTKEQVITEFLQYASDELRQSDILIGADVFGTVIGSRTDTEQVGQNYKLLGQTVDVLSPMIYPSHYAAGVFGFDVPDAYPYGTVLAALNGSSDELSDINLQERAIVRPWLQAFTATWVNGHIVYDGNAIREQINAVYDAGYEEWILWNASNRYSYEGLLPE